MARSWIPIAVLAASLFPLHSLATLAPTPRPLALGSNSDAIPNGANARAVVILRFYGSLTAPEGQGERPGWGGGLAVGHGLFRHLFAFVGVAHHELKLYSGWPPVQKVTPVTIGLETHPSEAGRLAPWVGVGLGVYHLTSEYSTAAFDPVLYGQRLDSSASDDRFGIHWGVGAIERITTSASIQAGMRFHQTFGNALNSDRQQVPNGHLINLELGLSTAIR